MGWPSKSDALYDGSTPCPREAHEFIAQETVKGSTRSQIDELLKKPHNYTQAAMKSPKIIKRIKFLTKKAAEKTVLTKEYIIEGILKVSQEAPKHTDKLKAYELLGKTMALFTDKIHISGMPKRIIIRSESGTEQLGSTTNDANTSPND